MDRQSTQIILNWFGTIIPPVNMDRIVLLEYAASATDVHIEYFHFQQLITYAVMVSVATLSQVCRQLKRTRAYENLQLLTQRFLDKRI